MLFLLLLLQKVINPSTQPIFLKDRRLAATCAAKINWRSCQGLEGLHNTRKEKDLKKKRHFWNRRFALLFEWLWKKKKREATQMEAAASGESSLACGLARGSRDVACLKVHVQPGPSPLYADTACACVSCDCVGIVSSSSSIVASFVVHSGRILSREKTRMLNTWLYFETSPGSKEGCVFDPHWRCLCHCSAERNVKLQPFSAVWKCCSKPLCIM